MQAFDNIGGDQVVCGVHFFDPAPACCSGIVQSPGLEIGEHQIDGGECILRRPPPGIAVIRDEEAVAGRRPTRHQSPEPIDASDRGFRMGQNLLRYDALQIQIQIQQ